MSLRSCATRNYNDKCRSWYVLYSYYVPVTGLRSQYVWSHLIFKAHSSIFTLNYKKTRNKTETQHLLCSRQTLNRLCFTWLFLNSEVRASSRAWWFLSYFLIFFWPYTVALTILSPQLGIKPMPPVVEVQSLNHWTTREVLWWFFKKISFMKHIERQSTIMVTSRVRSNLQNVSLCQFPCLQNGDKDNAYWECFLWGSNQVLRWEIENSTW